MHMPLIQDKYVPTEWFNGVFSEIVNCEIMIRPSDIGFKAPIFFFKKREWLYTEKTYWDYNKWQGVWDFKLSKFFDDKIFTYTDQGYVYSFDWDILEWQKIDTTSDISQSVEWSQVIMDATAWVDYVLQEFTAVKTGVLKSVKVKIKKNWTVDTISQIQCQLRTAWKTEILLSETRFLESEIGTSYGIYTFYFPNYPIVASTKYSFSIRATETTNTGNYYISTSTTDVYATNDLYTWTLLNVWSLVSWKDAYFSIDVAENLTYNWTDYMEDVVSVSYLWGGRYPDSATELTVTAYNNVTWEITVSPATVTTWYITKNVYVNTRAVWWTNVSERQRWLIAATNWTNKMSVTFPFTIDLNVWDKLIFYNKIIRQLWFPQLRKKTDNDYMYARDLQWNTMYWYFPNATKMLAWDNRIIWMKKDKQWLIATSNTDLEITTPITVDFGNSEAVNLCVYGGYIMVFFADKIWLIKKEIIDAEAWTFVYLFQDLLEVGLYSERSFIVHWWSLYIFWSDKRMYAVDLTVVNFWEVVWSLNEQWQDLVNYLKKFTWWEVNFHYEWGTLYLCYRNNAILETQVYKYVENYKWRLVDNYSFDWNFLNFMYSLNDIRYTVKDNIICSMTWLNDLGTNIEQKIKMYWAVEWVFDLFTSLQLKIRLWMSDAWIGWKVIVEMWWYYKRRKERDIEKIEIVNAVNNYTTMDGTFWWWIIGTQDIWGTDYATEELIQDFFEILDCALKIGKKWSYLTIEFYNNTDKQLIFGWVVHQYNTLNPLVVQNKWVLS